MPRWPPTIGWYMDRNAPWIAARRGLRPRGDVWLASDWWRRLLERLIAGELGAPRGAASRVAAGPVLLHRIPSQHREIALEVWGHGARLGAIEYTPRGWAIYPSGALASMLEGLGAEAVEIPEEPGRRLKGRKIRLPGAPGPYALVRVGRYAGFARRVEGDTYRVKDLAPRGFRVLEPGSLEASAGANRAYLERLAAEAREFIRAHAPGEGPVYVAVSGGADSTAAALLAWEALGPERVVLVYADTGMEFPESRRTVERLASMLGVRLDIVESGVDPVREIARRGLMTRDYRWCTRLLKLRPLREYYRSRRARVVVDGARALESTARATLPRAGENPVIPGVRRLLPLLRWTRLEVQLYLALRGAPVNPLYGEGFTRIGCIVCPAMARHELEAASRLYPRFYKRLAEALSPGDPEGALRAILEGGWRWGRPQGTYRRV